MSDSIQRDFHSIAGNSWHRLIAKAKGECVIAYKLLKRRRDGSLGPLFINARQRIPVGVWLEAEDHPTKGFAHRPGWHCTPEPHAPHLTMKPKHGPERVWCIVELQGVEQYARPKAQGGTWLLARKMKVIETIGGQNE